MSLLLSIILTLIILAVIHLVGTTLKIPANLLYVLEVIVVLVEVLNVLGLHL